MGNCIGSRAVNRTCLVLLIPKAQLTVLSKSHAISIPFLIINFFLLTALKQQWSQWVRHSVSRFLFGYR